MTDTDFMTDADGPATGGWYSNEAATFGDRSLAARVAGTRMPSDRMFNRLLARQDRELQARHRTERDAFLRAQMASRERHEARLDVVVDRARFVDGDVHRSTE